MLTPYKSKFKEASVLPGFSDDEVRQLIRGVQTAADYIDMDLSREKIKDATEIILDHLYLATEAEESRRKLAHDLFDKFIKLPLNKQLKFTMMVWTGKI